MADHYFGVARGAGFRPDEVTAGTSSGATDIELRIADAANCTKKDIANAFKVLQAYILNAQNAPYPPL